MADLRFEKDLLQREQLGLEVGLMVCDRSRLCELL